jgi:hypothetical protein
MSGRPAGSDPEWTVPGPRARGPRPTARSPHGPGHARPRAGRGTEATARTLRTAVTRLARWPLARKARQCASRAPVSYMDGLSVHDLYRWQRRCELPTGHAGQHRSDEDSWG